MTRLALGTVQFGQRYGVANASGQVEVAEVSAILASARGAGVDMLDTAIAYGNSESTLGDAGVSSWRVITKLPPMPADVVDAWEWVHTHVQGSLQRLRVPQLEAVLLHRPSDLFSGRGAELLRALERLTADTLTRAVGVSVSSPAELDSVWRVWHPDIVQAPCNVLDRRLLRSGWLDRLLKGGVRVHARSLFLQGLLLMPASRRPAWFDRWSVLLNRWTRWCEDHSITPLRGALAFACSVPGLERLVVGVDRLPQWQEILSAASGDSPVPPDDLCSDDIELIEPSRWKLT